MYRAVQKQKNGACISIFPIDTQAQGNNLTPRLHGKAGGQTDIPFILMLD